MIRRFLSITAMVLIMQVLQAQEVLTGLQVNPLVRQWVLENGSPAYKSNVQLTLPFFDDFAGQDIFPSQSHWADQDVFINNDYPVFPVTEGVATFDAINADGLIYPNASDNRFIADYLTSHTIRLDSVFAPQPRALSPADSVYLSFYYQPEGLGFFPAQEDSLVLEFWLNHPVDTLKRWVKVWSAPGMSLNEFHALHGQYFKRVMIPVIDEGFFNAGFKFRFYNIASIRIPTAPSQQSNRDHWHLDYVFLNLDRHKDDYFYSDISFANKPGSFLKTYHSMPYRQYKQNFVNEMRDSLHVRVTNLNNINTSGSYRYSVSRADGSHLQTYETAPYIFQPFFQAGYVSQRTIARPPVTFVFPVTNEQQASFNITHILQSHSQYAPDQNDTIRFRQVFADYYAYDDGMAEAGYGLTYAGTMAVRFRLNAPDTLSSVRIFFNRTLNNSNQRHFHLQVWNDFGGKPGNLIHETLFQRVEYNDGLNWFHTYFFEEPVLIDNQRFPGLIFYIGIEQTTPDVLNIGFDRNNITRQEIFYFYGNTWLNTMYNGSVMLRPVIGTTGIIGSRPVANEAASLNVYPNPVSKGVLFIDLSNNEWLANGIYTVMNLNGKIVQQGNAINQIDVSALPPGMYMLRISCGNYTGIARFVINR